jgi:hypothetical protein
MRDGCFGHLLTGAVRRLVDAPQSGSQSVTRLSPNRKCERNWTLPFARMINAAAEWRSRSTTIVCSPLSFLWHNGAPVYEICSKIRLWAGLQNLAVHIVGNLTTLLDSSVSVKLPMNS